MKTSSANDGTFTFEFGRALGRSRGGRYVLTLGVAAFFGGLAFAAWRFPKWAATTLSLGLLIYGLQQAWRFLPIPDATRERWAREERIAEQCPAHPLRGFLWGSLGVAAVAIFRTDAAQFLDPSTWIIPAVFLGVGLVGHFLCQRFVHTHPNGDAPVRSPIDEGRRVNRTRMSRVNRNTTD